MSSKREEVFDYMKGIGILAMIVGHCYPNTVTAHVIYSFHMPLFFIISGYFINFDRPIFTSIIRDAKRLLLPILYTISCVIIYRIIVGQGLMEGSKMGAFAIGPMWFLLALFWSRTILRLIIYACSHTAVRINYLILLLIAVTIGALTYFFHSHLPYWHLYVVEGLTALQFVTLGYVLQKRGCPFWLKVAAIILWIVALFFGGLGMLHCEYKLYPIDILGSVGGTFVIYYICKGLEYLNNYGLKLIRWVMLVLSWCGVHSLLILCVHTFDLKTINLITKACISVSKIVR